MVKFKTSHVTLFLTLKEVTPPRTFKFVDSKFSFNFKLVQFHNCPLTPKMSFAGRRRGNKVKKGVQFTVMVVGMLIIALPIPFASRH